MEQSSTSQGILVSQSLPIQQTTPQPTPPRQRGRGGGGGGEYLYGIVKNRPPWLTICSIVLYLVTIIAFIVTIWMTVNNQLDLKEEMNSIQGNLNYFTRSQNELVHIISNVQIEFQRIYQNQKKQIENVLRNFTSSELGGSSESYTSQLTNNSTMLEKLSKEMKKMQETYVHQISGLSPLLADDSGHYRPVNWEEMQTEHFRNWTVEWKNLTAKSIGILYFPPLILPRELGGWPVQLFVRWWNHKFRLFGKIIHANRVDENFPEELAVHFIIKFYFNTEEKFVIDKKIYLVSSLNHVLHTISPYLNETWPMPEVYVQVKL